VKFAVSNIALPAYNHRIELSQLASLGLSGLEVAPSRIWQETWLGLSASEVSGYRREVEQAGLSVVGLHSLLFDQPELGLFQDTRTTKRTLDFFTHLSGVCRDLGGKTLIWGGGRHRGDVPENDAYDEAISFMGELTHRIESHGTCFCFEPLGPADSDFINSVYDSIKIVEAVNHPALKVQLDAKALAENGEVKEAVFCDAAPYITHFHANEPGLGVIGSTGKVPHDQIASFLYKINYSGFVSIEQRMLDAGRALKDIEASYLFLDTSYSRIAL
jgi:sugar phosphate isomerase/epimerase